MKEEKKRKLAAKILLELKQDRARLSSLKREELNNDEIESYLSGLDDIELKVYTKLNLGTGDDKSRASYNVTRSGTLMEDFDEANETEAEDGSVGLTGDEREEFRGHILRIIDHLIGILQVDQAKDARSIMGTEKEFLSEKVPKDVAENIASFVTGKKGAIGAQMSQLRTDAGITGVPSKGGRKTKRKQQKRKKTHGRRV
jgi:hypothetical protein